LRELEDITAQTWLQSMDFYNFFDGIGEKDPNFLRLYLTEEHRKAEEWR